MDEFEPRIYEFYELTNRRLHVDLTNINNLRAIYD
jgi:hypothetical protein